MRLSFGPGDRGLRSGIVGAAAILLATAIGAGRPLAQADQATAPAAPRMVEDVFKNVQALKGIGVDDFMLTMGIMSAALGSDCVGCHPSAGTDHVDWTLDTPRKRTARRCAFAREGARIGLDFLEAAAESWGPDGD